MAAVSTVHYVRAALVILLLLLLLPGCGGGGGGGPTDSASSTGATAHSGPAVTLTWDPPTTNADGSPLTDLAGYKVHYGTATGAYTKTVDVHNVTTHRVEDLAPGTYYFAVTAYDLSGNESDYSNEVHKTLE